MKMHQKLVRDEVVSRILAKGERCTHHIATSDAEKRDRLGFKLLEEIEEFGRNKSYEELIDVQEVVLRIESFGRHARPSDEAIAEWIGTMPSAEQAEEGLTAAVYSLMEAGTNYAAHPSDQTFGELVIELERVTRITGFDRDTLESMRKHKVETHGGFEKWIILDEA